LPRPRPIEQPTVPLASNKEPTQPAVPSATTKNKAPNPVLIND
jgi:hypothetical protein